MKEGDKVRIKGSNTLWEGLEGEIVYIRDREYYRLAYGVHTSIMSGWIYFAAEELEVIE